MSLFGSASGGRTLVIGEAFGRNLTSVSRLTLDTSIDLVDAERVAREMTHIIWGGYVAVLGGPDDLALLSDPSGALPFVMVDADGIGIATDNLTPALCRAIGWRPQISWPSLVTTLVAPAAAVHLPHLVGVRHSVAGRLHYLGKPGADTSIWSPATLARRTTDWSPARMRSAVDRSVETLSTSQSAIQLSGGLDSSIILTSLCRNGAQVSTINYATKAAGGDERRYAAEVSVRCGSPMATCEATSLPSYAPLFAHAPGAHPFVYGVDDAFEHAVGVAARQAGCNRMLTGQGGDAVFFQPATPLVAIDRFRAYGFNRPAFSPLLNDARRTRSSIWHHLLPALADQFRPAVVPTQKVAEQLLTPRARALVSEVPSHPWLHDADDLPPGKRMHLVMLANSQIFHARRPDPDGIILRHPLLAQPVLEAVLPIPSYELAIGSNDRGLARAVFADRLPVAIAQRRGKGDAADHYSRAALANLSFLRDMLLDGVLVREGMVDQAALSAILTREHLFYSLDYQALALHATCEAWARYWSFP